MSGGEVPPSIRKHGVYAKDDLLNDPDALIAAVTHLKEERERRKMLEAKVEVMEPQTDCFGALVDRELLTCTRYPAKELDFGPKAFVDLLLREKFVYRNLCHKLRPYEKYVPTLFQLKDFINWERGHAETANVPVATGRLDDKERDTVVLTDAVGRPHQNTIISESGLFTLIIRKR